jgi:hypothetical protein
VDLSAIPSFSSLFFFPTSGLRLLLCHISSLQRRKRHLLFLYSVIIYNTTILKSKAENSSRGASRKTHKIVCKGIWKRSHIQKHTCLHPRYIEDTAFESVKCNGIQCNTLWTYELLLENFLLIIFSRNELPTK